MYLSEKIFYLRSLPFFSSLSYSELIAIAKISTQKTFTAGEIVYSKGSVPQRLSLTVSGSLTIIEEACSEGIEVASETLGIAALLFNLPLSKKCIASPSGFCCLQIKRNNFFSIINECPDLLLDFMETLNATQTSTILDLEAR